ncbi:cupin domain-containing protein [Vibrio tritonius]|uniref:cupin domain-containing protein n=1 Tax=Vibrio tritonius TaxID=1435069 RepID=UPI000838E8D2|nr:cupin domain-containing protein [Vibrio tritonius]
MANYSLANLGKILEIQREVLHDKLSLSGSELSINNLPAGVGVPFVHAHKLNEEVYVILSGEGVFYLDGDEIAIKEGDALKVAPQAARCIKASDFCALSFICIQTKADSLEGFTENDGYPVEVKTSWM